MEKEFDFEDFYKSYQQEALRYASVYIYDTEDARDVVSDAWVRLWELKDTLDNEKSVSGLLFSVIRNKCVDYLRRRMCRNGLEKRLKQSADRISDNVLASLYHKELFRILGQTLSGMSDLRQRIYKEVRLEGMTYLEVAKNTQTTKRVVEYQLKKADEAVNNTLKVMYG